MVFKKILAMLLGGLMLCSSLTVSAYAEATSAVVESEIAPAYEIASNAQSSLIFSGTTAYCTSNAGGFDAVSITVEQTLQKQGFLWMWYKVDGASWTKTLNKDSISLSNTKSSLSSGKYRLKSVFTFTDKNGKSETITVYSNEKSI